MYPLLTRAMFAVLAMCVSTAIVAARDVTLRCTVSENSGVPLEVSRRRAVVDEGPRRWKLRDHLCQGGIGG